MTWAEIKQAVENAGIQDKDEISMIQCDIEEGDKTFQVTRLSKTVKLTENFSRKAWQDASGCAT